MSQIVDSWQSESLFPRSWDILLLKMLFLECRGSRMLFYAIFWRYVLSNTAVGWQHKQVSGTDWRSAQPVRKCDIALFLGKQKWLLGKLSVHEIFCNIDLFSFLLASNHQIVDKKNCYWIFCKSLKANFTLTLGYLVTQPRTTQGKVDISFL